MEHKGIREIKTDRLILRQVRIEDAPFMVEWTSDEIVTRYLTWSAYSEIEKAIEYINFCIEENKKPTSYKWCIADRQTDQAIGGIEVVSLNTRLEIAEIGYCLSRKCWNKGIMSEALNAVINYLFLEVGFNRIQATHHVDNPASGKVMQKCGMRFEGIRRQAQKDNEGNFCDIATYAIIKEDFIKWRG